MEKNNSNSEEKIREIQILDQTLQNLILQKQAFQMELSEVQSAKKEIKNSNEIFKIVGQLMVKTDREEASKELDNKEKLISLRIKSIENQEKSLSNRIEDIRKELI